MYYNILLLLLFSFTFSQTINHDPIQTVKKGFSVEVDVFADLQGQNIKSFNLFYKNSNQIGYFKEDLISEDGVYYSSKIPSDFINDIDIYYYISLETESDIFTLPIFEPNLNPFRVNVLEEKQEISNEISFSNSISHVNIIAPQHKEKILSDNLVVSVSYYEHDTIDINSIKISLDGSDITSATNIKDNYLIFTPSFNLAPGEHEIKLLFADDTGTYFQPIVWLFRIIEEDEKEFFTYSGKVWSDYIDNNIDGYNSSYNTSNMHFSTKTEWMNFNFKGRQSSLDNPLEQSKNRYSFTMKNNFIDIHYGDFYPQFDSITLNGNRVRGVGFNLHTKFFQINMIQGELNRAIQGSLNNALDLSYSQEYNVDTEVDENQLTLSRNDYTFQNELTALRLSLSNKDKFNWGLNLVKVKDNIESVNSLVDGAIINLGALTEKYDSDSYVDIDSTGTYTAGDILYEDINQDGILSENVISIVELDEFIIYETPTITVGYCYDDGIEDNNDDCEDCGIAGCPIKQKIWNIEILYDDLENVLAQVDLFSNELEGWQENYLEENWSDTPKDNFVIGTDLKISSNKVKINASIALSAFNNNIWDPITTKSELDTILDDFQDCYVDRTYGDYPFPNDCTDDIQNCEPGDYYWSECLAYLYTDGENNPPLPPLNGESYTDYVDKPGTALDDFPDPQDLEDLIHYNPLQMTPMIPSLFDEAYGKSFSDILNYPEVAYDFNVRLIYPIQNIHFGIKKVGAKFISLGNSYLQSDTQETYISDRIKLFKNRMFLLLSWKSISNGLTDISSSSESDKYDINISYYPKITLPSFTINYGIYDKNSGGSLYIYTDYDEYGSGIGVPIDSTDATIMTETDNLNIYMNYNFNLFKMNHTLGLSLYNSDTKDLLLEKLFADETYISPCSASNNYNLSLRSFINDSFNTDFYFSNSSYSYSKEESSAYSEQDILSARLGMNYNNNKLVDKFGAWIDYSKGDGSSSYSQYGLKLLINLKLYNNLFMDINLRYYNRKIVDEDDYQNSIIKANISYNF